MMMMMIMIQESSLFILANDHSANDLEPITNYLLRQKLWKEKRSRKIFNAFGGIELKPVSKYRLYTLLDVEFVDHVCLIAVSVKLFHIKIGEYKQRHRPLSFSPVEFSSTSGSNKYTYSHAGRNGTHCGNYLVLKFKGMGFWSVLTALYISNLGLKNLILEMVSSWRLRQSVCGYLESS